MSTHGSSTKAVKVRNQTPGIESTERNRPGPRINNRRKYERVLSDRRSFRGRRRRRR